MLFALLYLLLYALICILIIEVVLLILGTFLVLPGKVRQILYAIAGVIILIYLIQLLAGSPAYFPSLPRR